jgi:hypothetical protein
LRKANRFIASSVLLRDEFTGNALSFVSAASI